MTSSAPTPSDRDWPAATVVDAERAGDPAAIETLVVAAHPHVSRFARTLCSSEQDAEEAAQEALLILFRRVGTLRASAALGSWLFQVVRNECLRRARVALRMTVVPDVAGNDEESAEGVALRRIAVDGLVEAIAELPQRQRAVLIMRDLKGYSGRDTAAAVGLSISATKSVLHRARESVRHRLAQATGPTSSAEK